MSNGKGMDYGSRKQAPVRRQETMWRLNAKSPESCLWSAVDSTLIRGALDAATRAGGAIMCSATSDGGAYSIVVLHAGEKLKEYPHGSAECEQVLRDIIEYFTDALA